MKKITKALVGVIILGMIIGWGVKFGLAEDKSNKPEQAVKPVHPSRPESRPQPPYPRPPMGQQLGVSEALSNANIQKENQRHREVTERLSQQAMELQQKISIARNAKMEELNKQKKSEPEQTQGTPDPEKIKEEMDKVTESFRLDAEKIAVSVIAELVLYQKNLADTLAHEEVDIKSKITENILISGAGRPSRPSRPPVPAQTNPRKAPESKGDANKPADAPK